MYENSAGSYSRNSNSGFESSTDGFGLAGSVEVPESPSADVGQSVFPMPRIKDHSLHPVGSSSLANAQGAAKEFAQNSVASQSGFKLPSSITLSKVSRSTSR
jgi:hypothetical protein